MPVVRAEVALCAVAFHLAVRTGLTHRAAVFQLPVRARVAVHAPVFHLTVGTRVTILALVLLPSVRAPLTFLHYSPPAHLRLRTASHDVRIPEFRFVR